MEKVIQKSIDSPLALGPPRQRVVGVVPGYQGLVFRRSTASQLQAERAYLLDIHGGQITVLQGLTGDFGVVGAFSGRIFPSGGNIVAAIPAMVVLRSPRSFEL